MSWLDRPGLHAACFPDVAKSSIIDTVDRRNPAPDPMLVPLNTYQEVPQFEIAKLVWNGPISLWFLSW